MPAYKIFEAFNPEIRVRLPTSSDGVIYEAGPFHYVQGMLQNEGWRQVDAIESPKTSSGVPGIASNGSTII